MTPRVTAKPLEQLVTLVIPNDEDPSKGLTLDCSPEAAESMAHALIMAAHNARGHRVSHNERSAVAQMVLR